QPCSGSDALTSVDEPTLARSEFELTDQARERFGLDKALIRQRTGKFKPRLPQVKLNQLVLTGKVHAALQMALAQARHSDILMRDWGLGEMIPCGRAVTLLFHGPPGTGKTACAEAIAHELGRPILLADYSQILDCWVGGTEKNLARIFREARTHHAVLFW